MCLRVGVAVQAPLRCKITPEVIISGVIYKYNCRENTESPKAIVAAFA